MESFCLAQPKGKNVRVIFQGGSALKYSSEVDYVFCRCLRDPLNRPISFIVKQIYIPNVMALKNLKIC